ncbi:hypothetical protein FPY71_00395 [Aureimonas fodinaquatilis]|uniref:Uncharacterized protein n=1 Tax=Aureimonas fodinaquatilis TaxID=2565783 RepID=A0A5B0E0J0_9HYPH|nr:hypothetical protein [Aureimonas fodinaquatilis]KAA0971635.1 hypothetical protein FPY71_00395 [Aureimonas fodinaquatilis]
MKLAKGEPEIQSVLLDVREGGGMRGFHLLGCAAEMLRMGAQVEFWALKDDNPDVGLALALMRADTGQLVPRWDVNVASKRFSVFLSMADIMPADKKFKAACRLSRHALVGLMFPFHTHNSTSRLTVMSGHDISAFAQKSYDCLAQKRRGFWPL